VEVQPACHQLVAALGHLRRFGRQVIDDPVAPGLALSLQLGLSEKWHYVVHQASLACVIACPANNSDIIVT
jgi:hypothetical protein